MRQLYYQLKIQLRSPGTLFWTLVFPIFLGGMFYIMFSDLENKEQFSELPVGVVITEDNEQSNAFIDIMKEIETTNGTSMFTVTEYNQEDADKALKDDTIQAYMTIGKDITMTAKEAGPFTSIIKIFLDEYLQNVDIIEEVAKNHPERLQTLVTSIFENTVTIETLPIKGQDKSVYAQYFFAAIAMTCLMASMFGVSIGNKTQANLSDIAARRNVAPTSKMKQLLTDFFAAFIIYSMLTTIVLLVFMIVYKQEYKDHFGLIFLGTLVGNFTGLSAGMFISGVMPGNAASKEGLCTSFFLVSSFLSGLQWTEIVYYLEKGCPIVNRVNPATLIVNSFKSLYVYEDVAQYGINLATLIVIGTVLLTISILKMRRTKYASI